jgi:hypothetical protein
MHEGKHGILDDMDDMDELFGNDEDDEEEENCNCGKKDK